MTHFRLVVDRRFYRYARHLLGGQPIKLKQLQAFISLNEIVPDMLYVYVVYVVDITMSQRFRKFSAGIFLIRSFSVGENLSRFFEGCSLIGVSLLARSHCLIGG